MQFGGPTWKPEVFVSMFWPLGSSGLLTLAFGTVHWSHDPNASLLRGSRPPHFLHIDHANPRRGCHFRRVGSVPPRRLRRLINYFRVDPHVSCELSRASGLVHIWLCEFSRTSWLVQAWRCDLSRASWLVHVWLCDKAGNFTGFAMLSGTIQIV